jgi:hypothetical protein
MKMARRISLQRLLIALALIMIAETKWSTIKAQPFTAAYHNLQVSMAASSPCGSPALDACADIGEPSDEVYHSLVGWSINEIGGPVIPPSGDSSKRFQLLRGDNSLILFVPQANTPYILLTEVEDGGCDDSFEIYVNGQGPVYTYFSDPMFDGAILHTITIPANLISSTSVTITYRNIASDNCGLAAVFNAKLEVAISPLVSEARLDIGMPYNTNRGCPSPYVGCGGPYHGFYNGVCTDLAMDAYNAGVPFNIQNALYDDHRAHPGRYRYGTARNAEDMRRYFNHNQQLLPHNQSYQPGDIAFFDWNGDGLTNHVNVVSEVDTNGRPLKTVDATGVYAGNPSGRALEHDWSGYYDQHIQAHGRLSGGLATVLPSSVTTETLQVLRIAVDSPSVTLRLQDENGKSTSATYDENLVASNIESFIPYIPGGAYADLGTGKVISVTQPLSNTTQYLIELTGEASAQYHLSIQTLQDGGVTASAYFTESIALGETQGITLQLSAPGGVISFVASTPAPMPKVSMTPGEIEMTGLPGTLVQTAINVTETGGQQALNGVSASISDVMNQNGQVVAGTLFTVTPASFSVPAGGSQSIQLEIDLANIQPGIYQGNLLITSTNGGTRSIPLSLVVRPFDVFMPMMLRNAP